VDKLDALIDNMIIRLGLEEHSSKTSETLSGGNKRKLALGIALIGNPHVLLIDEASSGLDPVAKRKLWTLISDASKDRCTVLTTHSMEEAEALCTRAGIMSHGELLCLGSVQHLKSKYLSGYLLDIYLDSSIDVQDNTNMVGDLLKVLPGASILEQYGRFLRIDFPHVTDQGLSGAFRTLLQLKETNIIQSYSIKQSSLEQVFLKLTTNAHAPSTAGVADSCQENPAEIMESDVEHGNASMPPSPSKQQDTSDISLSSPSKQQDANDSSIDEAGH